MSMTIGELIDALKGVENQTAIVEFDFAGTEPTEVDSWRGVYAEPALGWRATGYSAPDQTMHHASMIVAQLIANLEGCIGKVFTGWKGGDYTYGSGDTLHIDNPGDCSNTELVRVEDRGYTVILHTERNDF